MWNSFGAAPVFGPDAVEVFTSLDNVTYTSQGTVNFKLGDGTSEDIAVSYSNVRFVKFDILSNHDGEDFTTVAIEGTDVRNLAALAEVRFVDNTVPEPSSSALLGLGGLALILRRRM